MKNFMTQKIYDEEAQPLTVFDEQGGLNKPKSKMGMAEAMGRPISRAQDPNLIGLELTGAKTAGQDADKLMPAGFQREGTAAQDQYEHELESAAGLRRSSKSTNFMDDMLRRGTDPNVAAKVSADVVMADVMKATTPGEKFISTGQGVFSTKERGIVRGTKPEGDGGATLYPYKAGMPAQVMLPGGIPGVIDPEKGYYKPQRVGYRQERVKNPDTNIYETKLLPNVDTDSLKGYESYFEEADPSGTAPVSTVEGQTVEAIVHRFMQANPEMTEEAALEEARGRGYIK